MPNTKLMDSSSKRTVLISIVMLALFSWLAFWTYTQVSVDSTQDALSSQLHEKQLYRFDSSLAAVNQRVSQLELQAKAVVDQYAQQSAQSRLKGFQSGLEQLLRGSHDVAGAALYTGWPSSQAQMVWAREGTNIRQVKATGAPDWQALEQDELNKALNKGERWWSPMYVHPQTGRQVVTLVQPTFSAQTQLNGFITLDWNIAAGLQLVQGVSATPDTLFWLSDTLGQLAYPPEADSAKTQQLMAQANALTPMNIFLTGFDHIRMEDAVYPVELYYAPVDNNLRLSVAVPLAATTAPLDALSDQHQRYLLVLGMVIVALTLLGLWKLIPALHNLRSSNLDKLTGLPNRLRLMQDLEKDSSVSLVLLNLDRFREVNSLFGDSCGDLILREVALRLESFLSGIDHSGAKLYRIDADEFAIALPRRRPEMVGTQLEEMLVCIRRDPVLWQNHEIGLSATIGAVVPWFETPQEHSLYIHAREALREARTRGLHCRVYDGSETLTQEFEHNQKWAGKLRDALDTEGLVAWYQPILNNTTGRIDKYECLVRMLDQDGGEVISPGKFLGVAGKLRMEGHITRVMVEKCFQRFANTATQFSINLSYSDLLQEDLKAFILQRLDETGVGPRVIFELLETANIENYEQVRAFVGEVKKRGCRIAIDDFGTGYSNFEHLLQLQVDFLKIDGSLIRNLDKDPNSRRVARGIVGLARSMKIETVAEYVHSPEIQMEVLRLGISFSQGELIGMPEPELRVSIPKELTRLSYSGRNVAKSVLKV